MGRSAIAALAAFLALIGGGAQAQTWPASPIKLVVPFAPGGAADLMRASSPTRSPSGWASRS